MAAPATEVDAYIWIKRNLDLLGWDARNPLRSSGKGQVYTQNEVFADPIVGDVLKPKKPENVVIINTTTFWVIEAKRTHGEMRKAVREAQQYADRINKDKTARALFISGVAGNDEDSYLVESYYWDGEDYVPITANDVPLSALLSPEVVEEVMEQGPNLQDVPLDTGLFLSKAELINEILHEGAVNKNARARVMAAVLLAILESVPDLTVAPTVLIRDINSRADHALGKEGKGEFFRFIKLALPPTEDNHVKFKRALVRTIQELLNLNIRSAMRSGHDVLGKFYEVFLKYGNGAKEIGIVLTPRHITRFAVEALGVSDRDTVYDPTCGTGGFLVAAFDHVRLNAGADAIERFKEHNLFGIEQEAEVAALAIVNMIFRGDGKTNIREGNCFGWRLVRDDSGGGAIAKFVSDREEGVAPITRVLMNPPFKSTKGDTFEFKFVNHALAQMEEGGLLFAVLPYGVMVNGGANKTWRKNLLLSHTLVSVLTLPTDLFYPVATHTVGIIIRKGRPHPAEQDVLWVRSIFDGHLKSKGKRIPTVGVPDDFNTIIDDVRTFVSNPKATVENVPMFKRAAPVRPDDTHFEFVPENYLDRNPVTLAEIRDGVDRMAREVVAFLIRMGMYQPSLTTPDVPALPKEFEDESAVEWRQVKLTDLFHIHSGDFHAKKELDWGNVPLISCGDAEQGLVGFYDIPTDAQRKGAVTVAYNGAPLTAKYHPYPFGAKDDVAVLVPRQDGAVATVTDEVEAFAVAAIETMKWRYNYGRKCFRGKLLELEIPLPVKKDSGEIDTALIEALVNSTPYWKHVVAAKESAALPEGSPLRGIAAELEGRGLLPFPETDLSPTLQRTIAQKLADGQDDPIDSGDFLTLLEKASEGS